MKKFLYVAFFTFVFLFTASIIYLSTIGIETSKLNNLVIKEIKKKEPQIEVVLEKIKIKLDLKKFQLFLSTNNLKITYQNVEIPITELRIYTKLVKILKSKIEINQIVFAIEKLKIQDMQKLSIRIKPSNFKTYLLNNFEGGEIEKAAFDLNLDKDFKISDYQMSGTIKKVKAKIKNNFTIKNLSLNFIADKELVLINSVNASYKKFLISNGSIEVKKKNKIEIKGNFKTKFDLEKTQLSELFKGINFFKVNKIKAKGNLLHEFNLKIDKSFKIVDYDYKSKGDISQSQLVLKKSLRNKFIKKTLKKITFEKTNIEINFNKKNKNLLAFDGLYSTDNLNYKKFKIQNSSKKNKQTFIIDLNLSEDLFIDIINFQADSKKKSNIKSKLIFKNNKFIFKSINFTEGKNIISIKDLILSNKGEIESFAYIDLLTFKNGEENNNFKIDLNKKLSIVGEKYDSSHLLKLLSSSKKSELLKNFNGEIIIKLKKLITKSQIPLNDFVLMGIIEKGKFNKLSSKSQFSADEFLDITLKKDPNGKKILEIYSDYPQALLTDYTFFEGVKDGNLFYNSVIDETGSASKLTIENFKIIKAPAFATLLTLADLGGIADILSGKGMSFDYLEINMTENNNVTTVDEILALGKSVSLQMSGYIEKKTGLVSLSGTLIPAKTLNILVSKIPVVGKILVGKKTGEGIFGVSFKLKGLPGKIKTTVNPVKTLTPRFITRALEHAKRK
ncbi:MAG: AsmA-like C-terminal region [Pelagibacterales bacterium]|nr:AsmA-like C-terminal region [Pelagibacterales bacterium]|tara:strand:+ start:7526 stop:9715 length:2190 start_codon:yes stop_codon:yes gene_type:complete